MSGAELSPAEGRRLLPALLVGGGLAALCAAVVAGRGLTPAAGLLLLLTGCAVAYRFPLRWAAMVEFVVLIVLVVLAIPIKRYQFAVSLPFDLEPYRIVIAVVIALWLAALLVDPRVELRRTAFDAPLLLLGFAVIVSVVFNTETITTSGRGQTMDISDNVAKELLFLASFYLVFYLVVSVLRTPGAIHTVLKVLVGGATVVAAFAIVEGRTRYNVFDHLEGWVPLIDFEGNRVATRAGRLRVYASAQHPIALAAMLVMIVPIAIYLAYQTRRRIWVASALLLTLAAMGTVSRTGVVMFAAAGIVFMLLRPSSIKVVVIAALPTLIAVHLAVPGAIGGIRQAFFPPEGLVEDQTIYGGRLSSGRLGPQFEIIRESPAYGQGYGTRITSGPDSNALILDNQWLATAVETGLVGVAAWFWLFVRFVRRAGRAAMRDLTGRGWLLTALASSAAAFAVGMFTFDAFSFIQTTFVLFVLLAIGAATLAYTGTWPSEVPAEERQLVG